MEVAVPADPLGRGMHHHVGAVIEGAAEDRRGNGVIDHERQPILVRGRGPGVEIDDVQLRVADRSRRRRGASVVDQLGQLLGLVGVEPAHLDSVLRSVWANRL